jgi:hypothetical protein
VTPPDYETARRTEAFSPALRSRHETFDLAFDERRLGTTPRISDQETGVATGVGAGAGVDRRGVGAGEGRDGVAEFRFAKSRPAARSEASK